MIIEPSSVNFNFPDLFDSPEESSEGFCARFTNWVLSFIVTDRTESEEVVRISPHRVIALDEMETDRVPPENHTDLNELDADGLTPLHNAVKSGDIERVKTLLENGADPNKFASDGRTPLHRAVLTGDIDLVKPLLKGGGDPNKYFADNSWSSFTIAVFNYEGSKRNNSKELVRILLEKGADPDSFGSGGWNEIARDNHIELARMLLENGANPDLPDTLFGHTPLHEAVLYDNEELARILLENGADPHIPNKKWSFHLGSQEGRSAYQEAKSNGRREIRNLITARDRTIKLLPSLRSFAYKKLENSVRRVSPK